MGFIGVLLILEITLNISYKSLVLVNMTRTSFIKKIVNQIHDGGDIFELYNALLKEYSENVEKLREDIKEYIGKDLRPIIESSNYSILKQFYDRVKAAEEVSILRSLVGEPMFDPAREAKLLDDVKNKRDKYNEIPLDGMDMHDIILLFLIIAKKRQGAWHEKILNELKIKKVVPTVSRTIRRDDLRPEISPSSHLEGDELEKACEFGLTKYDDFLNHKRQHIFSRQKYFERNIVIAEQDFEHWIDAMEIHDPAIVVSGFMPAGKFHLGYTAIVELLKCFHDQGAEIYIPISDIEAHSLRSASYEDIYNNIINQYLVNFGALGLPLDSNRIHIYGHYFKKEVVSLAFNIGMKLPIRTLFSTFGVNFHKSATSIFFPAIQIADILYPQLNRNGEAAPTIIPCGVDQLPYVRRSRDISREYNVIKPGALVIKYLKGIQSNKMTSSKIKDAIFLEDTISTIKAKILNAETGGHMRKENHVRHGGIPELCNVYSLFEFYMERTNELESIHKKCMNGQILCGECKAKATDIIIKFTNNVKRKRDKINPREIIELENIEIGNF